MTTPASQQRTRLGLALRDLRERAGITNEHLAGKLGLSTARVSRVEHARVLPRRHEVERWLEAVGATEKQRDELLELVDNIRTAAVAFRQSVSRGRAAKQGNIGDLELSARLIRHYHLGIITGLLQVPEYARAVFTIDNVLDLNDVDAATAARMQRQQVLYEPGRRFEIVLAEHALWWRPSTVAVQRAQLDRIASTVGLPGVDLRVVPLGTPTPVTFHSFVLYEERGDDDPMVEIEHTTGEVFLNEPQDVATYQERFTAVQAAAIGGDDARALVRRIADQLHAE